VRFAGGRPQRRRAVAQGDLHEVDASLKRLGMDYVDLYQIHRWDANTPIEETMEALHDVVKAGKARYIGASSMFAWQFAKAQQVAAANGWTRFVSMQPELSLLYREEEREMLPLCTDQGVGVLPWSPLARGRLLLLEGVAVHVVAVAFPETGAVGVDHLQRAHPLGALPEVEVGDDDAHGAAMDRLDLLTLERVGDDRLVGGDVGQRQVGGVAVLGVFDHVRRTPLHTCALEQVAHAHTRPRGVELAPLRHAVDVEGEGGGWHRLQLVEADRERLVHQAVDRQRPLAGRIRGYVADVQHREAFRQVLALRQARRVDALLHQFVTVPIEESHSHSLPLPDTASPRT
jgi:hypothetical protein